ncbi:MAG: YgiQ family radical SAM protein [Solirubrobacterales bacterium]
MKSSQNMFLPINRKDLAARGWDQADIILVSGDAYVDHPSFGAAILGRFLESKGFRVGIIAQPDWRGTQDFMALGQPKLFFGVTAGNLDSMLNHYTADKKRRREDAYSPGGSSGCRPDRAAIVYTNRIRECFPGVPVVLGGIEASMRRLAHYDYWSDSVRRSVLLDAKADLLVYGMGEYVLAEIADILASGKPLSAAHGLRGTVYAAAQLPEEEEAVVLPAYDQVRDDPAAFTESYRLIYRESNPYSARPLAQAAGSRWVIQNPPAFPLAPEQLDAVYELPYLRKAHPSYPEGVPALRTVLNSVTSHRGCFGGCTFCTLALHQGRFIQTRTVNSIVREVETIARQTGFDGTITDIGGPTANMFGMKGKKIERCQQCRRTSCLSPDVCNNLNVSHTHSVKLLRAARQVPGVKHVFIQSGLRHDLMMADSKDEYLEELCRHHVSGQMKLAVEHVSPGVTRVMGKPGPETFLAFAGRFDRINQKLKKQQYIVSYFMSAHPGCGVRETIELAEFIRDHLGYSPEQVQNFTPTPMSLATCIYHTGIHPLTGEKIYVPRSAKERSLQRAVIQHRNPDNRELVLEALSAYGRRDLIGHHPKCLIRPSEERSGTRSGPGGGDRRKTRGTNPGPKGNTKPGGKGKSK